MPETVSEQPVDAVLRRTEQIAGIGIGLSSVEYLVKPRQFRPDGLLSWELGRTKYRWTTSSKLDKITPLFNVPGVQGLIAARLLSSAALVLPGTSNKTRAAAASTLAGTNWMLHIRNSYGSDGTDHMTTLLCAAIAASKAVPHDSKAREVCTMFIAAQSALAYAASGLCKLTSPYWRDGSAMRGVFRTKTFGHKQLGELFKRHPLLSKCTAWGTIGGELLFPLVLVSSRPVAKAMLSAGISFHIGNGVFMGLGRFIWTFGATYPSVMHHSKSLSKRKQGEQ